MKRIASPLVETLTKAGYMIILIDLERIVVDAGGLVFRGHQHNAEGVIGYPIDQCLEWIVRTGNGEGKDILLPGYISALKGEQNTIQYIDSKGFTYQWVFTPVTENGETIGAISLITDITDRVQEEVRLKRALDGVKVFAFASSHDLKQPVRTLYGQSQILSEAIKKAEGLPEKMSWVPETLDFITDAAEKLHIMIESLNTYAQISTSPPEKMDVPLAETIQQVVENLAALIEEENGSITTDIPAEVMLWTDAAIANVIQNIFENSLTYYEPGRPPAITVTHEQVRLSGRWWDTIHVSDNGIGIEADRLKEIFMPFYRINQGRETSEHVGLGMGLCRAIVEKNGGEIWATSKVGEGTTVTFRVPSKEPPDYDI